GIGIEMPDRDGKGPRADSAQANAGNTGKKAGHQQGDCK
ncbi:unnamed protein product, partial [marine sediment metagenome]